MAFGLFEPSEDYWPIVFNIVYQVEAKKYAMINYGVFTKGKSGEDIAGVQIMS